MAECVLSGTWRLEATLDINQSLLDAGFAIELKEARLQDEMPRENLAASWNSNLIYCGASSISRWPIRCSLTSPSIGLDGVSSVSHL